MSKQNPVNSGNPKAGSCPNAVSHGLLSKEVLLPGEDAACLNALREKYMADFEPQDEIETFLVDRMVACQWRLRRFLRIERHSAVTAPLQIASEKDGIVGGDYRYPSWQNYIRYETYLERQFYRALNALLKMQSRRGRNLPAGLETGLDDSEL